MTLALLFLLSLIVTPHIRADTIEDRVARLEKEVATLEAQISATAQSPANKSAPATSDTSSIVAVSVENKRFQDTDPEHGIFEGGIFWDATFTLASNAKPTRAIKGALVFTDLFDEVKLRVSWTITQPLQPGKSFTEAGSGIKYNQFNDAQQWLKNTDLKDMKVHFEVESAISAN